MRYTVRKSIIEVVGGIWMPYGAQCAQTYTITDADVQNILELGEGVITREAVSEWLGMHAGDFSSITDFHASIEKDQDTIDIPWEKEENEFTFLDATQED